MVKTLALLAATFSGPSVAEIVQTAEITGVSVSPDGRSVAYRVDRPNIGHNQWDLGWFMVRLAGPANIKKIGDGGSPVFSAAGVMTYPKMQWAAGGHDFYYLALAQGRNGLWRWPGAGMAQLAFTDDADLLDFRLEPDGRRLLYRVGASRQAIAEAETRAYEDGTLVDARLDMMQPLAGGAIIDGKRTMQRWSGPWFERARLLWDHRVQIRQVDLVADRISQTQAVAQSEPWLEPTSRSAYNHKGDRAEIELRDGQAKVKVSKADGTAISCPSTACPVRQLRALVWHPQRDELFLWQREALNRDRILRWTIGDAQSKTIAVGPGLLDGGGDHTAPCQVGERELICVEASSISPPRLVRVDMETGSRSLLADPNEDLRRQISVKIQTQQWTDQDGRAFTGHLILPPSDQGPVPLVIQYYGCDGFLKGGVGDEIPMIPLAQNGIAILCINKTQSRRGDNAVDDYNAALSGIAVIIDRLAQEQIIDRREVGIGGLSFGSEVALWTVRHSLLAKTATIASIQLEPYYYWANGLPGRGVPDILNQSWALGDPDSDRENWKTLSTALDPDSITVPVLFQLPESEARQMMELHTKLKRVGKPVDFYAFADEPHIKIQPRHIFAANQRNYDWYRFWLAGIEDPVADKQEQFARWRHYRDATRPSQ